ncbi:hypothetical protein BKH41_08495 [Helicobacter sp. 12S02232-10]|uniref:DNA type IV secretion system protein ComB10 n=1 Tax=Helicobacter sp. 12S02232-10 TaxID=1476197 RepID=UPI000BD9AAD5|nr:DNA type IV secretion system protein ComB10 [Helicobacter sp. 12S02232-10]PAF46738.1 hypothetical protein BKH41_08495 [Helicobacter sp. 12S02232-10]
MKKTLLFIGITILIIGIFFGSIFGYVYLTEDKKYNIDPKDNIQSLNDDKTKFPVTDYIFFEEPHKKETTRDLENIFKQEEPKEETKKDDSLKKDLEEAKTTTQPMPTIKKYTEDIFDSQDQDLRDSILGARNTSLSLNIKKNQNKNKKITFDFGDNKFSNQPSKDIATGETKLYRTITANKMIPAILINAISSDLSGKITAQVEDDIFASMGNAVLIPKGSQVIGFYNNNNQIGVNRLQVIWSEIITPQGVDILLTDASNADIVGKSGLPGKVNNKYWDRYGLALTLSTLANAITLTVANQTAKFPNYQTQQILAQGGQDISSIMQNIIQQQIKINPTIEVMAGSRIFINPSVHMWFPEPKNGEILVKYFKNIKELDQEEGEK